MNQAIGLGWAHSVLGVAALATVNPALAVIGGSTIATYVLIYTPIKARHEINTAIGAVVGAMPPVMGVAAVHPVALAAGWSALPTGLAAVFCDPFAIFLFAYQFVWQMVHFVPMQVRPTDHISHHITSHHIVTT